jgi:DmsE family decaheme c-type cytochrome
MHASEPLAARKTEAVNAQCGSCHLNVVAQFQKPFHHKLPEGAMSCVDCHNPHGSIRPAMLQSFASNEPGCFGCHGDKRGPFTFEHAPVRFEGCQACHEPHGSANPRMLIRANVRFVCLECHANLPNGPVPGAAKIAGVVPPSFHDLRSPVFQNCTVCHQKIHGSHVDRNLLK